MPPISKEKSSTPIPIISPVSGLYIVLAILENLSIEDSIDESIDPKSNDDPDLPPSKIFHSLTSGHG